MVIEFRFSSVSRMQGLWIQSQWFKPNQMQQIVSVMIDTRNCTLYLPTDPEKVTSALISLNYVQDFWKQLKAAFSFIDTFWNIVPDLPVCPPMCHLPVSVPQGSVRPPAQGVPDGGQGDIGPAPPSVHPAWPHPPRQPQRLLQQQDGPCSRTKTPRYVF